MCITNKSKIIELSINEPKYHVFGIDHAYQMNDLSNGIVEFWV